MNFKMIRMTIFILGICLILPHAFADRISNVARDYKTVTDDGKYVFVMLMSEGMHGNKDAEIRKLYKQSGLYYVDYASKNDFTNKPIYTIDEYVSGDYILSSDGTYLIAWGPWASSLDQIAMTFYAQGEELNHYHIRELVCDASKLERTVSHFNWKENVSYDDKNRILTVKTKDNMSHRFSVKTGMFDFLDENAMLQQKKVRSCQ